MSKLNQKPDWIVIITFLAVGLFLLGSFLIEPEIIKIQSQEELSSSGIRMVFVGDIMLNRGVEYMIKIHNNDWKWPFLKIVDYLKKADILFGNLESVISDKGTNVGSIYSLRAEPETIEGLTFAGFDILSLANNHAFDYTAQALKDTLVRLKMAGISFVGADLNQAGAFSPIIRQIKETKIAFLAYTNLGPHVWRAGPDTPGIAWIDRSDFEEIQEDIQKAKQESNVLIVSLHAGIEYDSKPNQFQQDFSKMAIEAGADLVIGHHPHVVQAYEKYKDGWIFYSLGNFVFDQGFSEETLQGQMVEVVIENGKINEVIPINIKINSYFQPEIQKD